MPMIETRDGAWLYVKDWGSGNPVILIHGWPLSSDSWDPVAEALASAGHRVISYDRRGFGRSEQTWGGYDYDGMTDDLADVMKATNATENVTLVGFSMGGGEVAATGVVVAAVEGAHFAFVDAGRTRRGKLWCCAVGDDGAADAVATDADRGDAGEHLQIAEVARGDIRHRWVHMVGAG